MSPDRRKACIALAGLALAARAHHVPRQSARHALDGWPVSLALTDHEGRPFTEERLRGRWTFLLFGDTTRCGPRCGDALAAVAALCLRIAPALAVKTTQLLFVSLDPRTDTPARLRQYLAMFDARFVGATGTPAALQALVHDLGEEIAGAPYRGSLLLAGPDAIVRAEYLPPFDVPRLTAAYLRERRGVR